LHNIANSVIILDEAQMLPINLLKPCMEVLRELTNSYNDTIILCTATQPALSENNEFVNGLKDVREIISEPEELCINLKRVEINCISNGNKKISDNELTKMIMKYNQVLCVVNTRHHARELYEKFDDKNGLYHLSALMCPVHRSEIISKIKNDLKNGKKCRVLSTQLIEAGVDIDFPVVFRSAAGIDSIAQSAGRCNREGKLSAGKVYIFYPEKDLPIGFLRQAAEEADAVMRKYSDLLSIEAINEYFRNLYWRNQDKLDKERILEKFLEGVGSINFPFREIAEQFKMMDSNMESIIIPYNDDAREIIKQLRYAEYVRKPACKAQRFSVQVYPHILKKLEGISVEKIRDNFFILTNEDLYSTDLGLNYDDPLFREAENNIF
jgi:CRISPR-associated endonuclease/helicase Cas3